MWNTRGPVDTRQLFTGKDGLLYDGDGILLATVDTFTAQVNVTNAKYQPLGDAQEHSVFASYAVSLTVSECIIEDDKFIQDLFEMMSSGQPTWWTLQGVLKGRGKSTTTEQRMIFRDCVPDGQIDLQNFTAGDVIKRQWNMACNCPPELQKLLTPVTAANSSTTLVGGTGR